MTDTRCNYPDRDEHLVAYLYDDIESTERTAFGSHLSNCRSCQEDLSALRGVRSALSTWAPPEPAFAGREPRVPTPERRAPRWWHEVPAWAQVAAALFVLGVSATIANLDVRYDRSGLSIRTGWSKPPASAENAEPWRAELAALQS
jgi:anti-sigma factor RsiW